MFEISIQRVSNGDLAAEPIDVQRFACITFVIDGMCFNVSVNDNALWIESSGGPLVVQPRTPNMISVYETGAIDAANNLDVARSILAQINGLTKEYGNE